MTNSNELTNILVVGIGGQGVMTASEILAMAAIEMDLDVKKTEVAGMAQRGGVVASHVRFGKKVLSPAIPKGEADIIIGFEPAESMRWATHLKKEGVAMVNTLRITPPVVNVGLFEYPEDPIGEMRKMGVKTYDFNAGEIAKELGEMRLVNTIMMGGVSEYLPFDGELLKSIIVEKFRQKKPELADLNDRAFEAGRKAAALSAQNAA